jgi:hypothetical protein
MCWLYLGAILRGQGQAQSLLYTGLASRFSVYSRGVFRYPPLQRRCATTAMQSAVVIGLPLRSPSGMKWADVNAYDTFMVATWRSYCYLLQ